MSRSAVRAPAVGQHQRDEPRQASAKGGFLGRARATCGGRGRWSGPAKIWGAVGFLGVGSDLRETKQKQRATWERFFGSEGKVIYIWVFCLVLRERLLH